MVEKVSYKVLKKIENVEIRKYPKIILAVVEGYEGDSGFNLLFNYISGSNKTKKQIQMTAPVITSEKIPMTAPVFSKEDYMAFALPSSYDIDTVPIPTNSEIKIKHQPEKTIAVLRFSGRTSRKQVEKQIEKLLEILKSNNIQIIDDPILMRYNSPFAPGFMRRNEVAVEIKNG
jgi:effector-binding domain-containing protein